MKLTAIREISQLKIVYSLLFSFQRYHSNTGKLFSAGKPRKTRAQYFVCCFTIVLARRLAGMTLTFLRRRV